MNPYEFLGVSEGVSKAELKRAYLEKIRIYHPDLHPGDEYALEMSKKINEAYQAILKNKKFNFDGVVSEPVFDEFSLIRNKYIMKISKMKYVDSKRYIDELNFSKSEEAIMEVYRLAKKDNIQSLLILARKKILYLSFISDDVKRKILMNIAQVIRNSSGIYSQEVFSNIEKILLDAVKMDAILGINRLEFLDGDDRLFYVKNINSSSIDSIDMILSGAILENKKGAIDNINVLGYLSYDDKEEYINNINMSSNVEQLRSIVQRAKERDMSIRDNKVSVRASKFFSSLFDSNGSEGKARKN